ncbi:MAG: hypothetical protein ACRBEQ_03615 [Hyphomonas sp.]
MSSEKSKRTSDTTKAKSLPQTAHTLKGFNSLVGPPEEWTDEDFEIAELVKAAFFTNSDNSKIGEN